VSWRATIRGKGPLDVVDLKIRLEMHKSLLIYRS